MILVTGGSGRVGFHLVRALLEKKLFVRVFERKASPIRERKNLEFFYGDITKKEGCEAAMKGVHIVYHLAAIVDYLAPKNLVYDVNVNGTRNIIEAAKKAGAKIIFLSSTAAMGKKLPKLPANEQTACRPTDFYGQTKLEAEKIVREAGGIIIRSADLVGPGFEEGYHTVIEKIAEGKMQIIGDGKNLIQYIHISDLIQALMLAKEKGRAGEIYIVAGPEARTQEECWKLLAKHLHKPAPTKKISVELARFLAKVNVVKAKLKRKRPSFIPAYVDKIVANREFDISKAREELGFEPKVSADEQAREMVEEYLKKKK